MPTFAQDLEQVKSLRQKQTELNKSAGADTTYAATFGDGVWDKIRSARADRGVSMMQEGVGTTMGQLETDPALMRERMGADVNPLTQDVLTARARSQNLSTLGTLGQFEAETEGTLEGAIGAQTNQLIAKAAAKKAEAEAAKSEADSLIEQIQLQMEQEKHNLSMAGKGETYEYTLPNGQVLRGLSAKEYSDLYAKYEGGAANVELKGAQATDMNLFKNIYKSAQGIQEVYKPEYTGLLDYIKGEGRKLTGKQTQGEASMRARIADHNTAIRNYISGAAIPDAEEKWLTDLMIKGIDSDQTVENKFKEAKDMALRKAGSVLSTAGYNIDPEEYFMQDVQIKQGTRPPLSSFDK